MEEIGLAVPTLGVRVHARRGDGDRRAGRLPAHRAAVVHPRRQRHRHRRTTPTSCARVAAHGLATSPVSEILIEQSVAGWKEFELEVMRDHADNVVVICSIENFDAMGVHTGDSITVAPAQTLTDVEYQRMRDAAFACIRRIGVDTGGSNIQFAVNPANGDMVVIEMNPRVSRSSALGEQGHRLPDRQDRGAARGGVPARRDHERHHRRDAGVVRAHHRLRGHQGAAVGVREAARRVAGARHDDAVGRRGDGDRAHVPRDRCRRRCVRWRRAAPGLNCDPAEREYDAHTDDELRAAGGAGHARAAVPARSRAAARRAGRAPPRRRPGSIRGSSTTSSSSGQTRAWLEAKRHRRPDAVATGDGSSGSGSPTRSSRTSGSSTRRRCSRRAERRAACDVTYKTVDTCAAEFAARTPYHYGTYEDEDEVEPLDRPAVVILGSGPNRIGQGVEFDYCCVHAAFALSDAGFETVMLNCNPETVSTDYDTSDRLFFEPLTPEDVLAVCRRLQERSTGRRRAGGRDRRPRRADAAEAGADAGSGGHSRARHQPRLDRPRRRPRALPARCATSLGIAQPPGGTATTTEQAAGHRRASSASRCWCGRRTCSAGAPCRSSSTSRASTTRWRRWPPKGQPRT